MSESSVGLCDNCQHIATKEKARKFLEEQKKKTGSKMYFPFFGDYITTCNCIDGTKRRASSNVIKAEAGL